VLGPQGVVQRLADWRKPTEGEGEFKMNINFMLPCSTLPPNVTWGNCNSSDANSDRTTYSGPMALCDQDDRENNEQYPCDPRHDGHFYAWQMYTDSRGKAVDDRNGTVNSSDTNWRQIATIYDYKDIKPGKWALYYLQGTPKNPDDRTYDRGATHVAFTGVTFQINGQGGIYSMTVSTAGKNSTNVNANFHTIVPANHISILWQIPQYVVITAAEILFSITGLEFSYSQAAPSMKSVVQALWLLTVAFGDLIILAIAAAALFSNMAVEMLAFAGAMVVVICVFILLSVFYYDYTFYTRDESEDDNDADVSGTVSTVE
uniref:Uncharacterized protein n=1 Tax=Plectus sambesii TaxID=2011161 RepID=A0A914VRC6_9BILA